MDDDDDSEVEFVFDSDKSTSVNTFNQVKSDLVYDVESSEDEYGENARPPFDVDSGPEF